MKKSKVSKFGTPYLHFGNGEPLVLIHGLGEVKEGWHSQFEFADQYELIIPDLRGHGECTKTEGISIQHFAEDIISLLKELQIESAHILGLSMGGAVAQEIYRQSPDLCRSLILVSTFHYIPKNLGKVAFKHMASKFKKLSNEGRFEERAGKMALYSWKDELVEQFHLYFQPKGEIFKQSLKSCLEVNNVSLLPKIKIPTLIISCQYDSVLPFWLQLCMHKSIPNSEFIIMRNTGHLAKLEATDRFNLLLRKFLNRYMAAA
ncbi:alpha/beta fold hydrolase [Bacillus sp. MRMR6]|uniref:alpha/beta fold hydrolase n=1 Tax=Bacillus sp. MRMR6 TaxID=1928617 RepID=UPI00095139CB|nr:alpha/beta hydrolase [Bacillus sp. MRMR6]OLS41876.1 alpha/beta hydrolase [Bacillus sp. MRMR6]